MSQSRQLAAIMFTDIVGYTALMGEDELAAFELLKKNRAIQKPIIEKFNGKWLKEIGDGVLASFSTVTDAVYCAATIQKTCENETDLKLRIGIHQGEVVFEGADVFGDGVNIASRLEPLAPVGGILVSESVHRNLGNKRGIETNFIRKEQLRNVKEPIKIYSVHVEDVEAEPILESSVSPQKVSPNSVNLRKITFAGAGVIIILLLSYFLYSNFSAQQQLANASPEIMDKSIAVLPFDNESADPENQYFVNGMMEDIRNNLSKIADLRVISKTSTEKYRGASVMTGKIAEELEVAYLLEGTVQKQGNQVKIHAQLIHGETDNHIWSDTYVRDISDVFKVQSEMAQVIANELYSTITPAEKQLIEKTPTSNLTAYDFYQRGREEHLKYWLNNTNRGALENAETFYHKAIEYDSTYAQAYTGLAGVYLDRYRWETFLSENFLDSMLVLANIALQFDNQSAEAFVIKGRYYFNNSNIDRAQEEYDQAIKFNPNYGDAYWMNGHTYEHEDHIKTLYNYLKAASLLRGPRLPQIYRRIGKTYALAGFKEKAIHYTNEALALDGDSAVHYGALAEIEDGAGNPQKSIILGELSYALDSTNSWITYLLGLQYSYLDKNEEYLKYMKLCQEILKSQKNPFPFGMFRVGHAYWVNSYKKEGKALLDEGMRFYNEVSELGRYAAIRDLQTFYSLAGYHSFLGDRDKAYEYLRMINQRQWMPRWIEKDIKNDPLFENIRDEPEFQKIAQELIAKYRSEHERVRIWLEKEGML